MRDLTALVRLLQDHSWFDGSCVPVDGHVAHWYGTQEEHAEHVAFVLFNAEVLR